VTISGPAPIFRFVDKASRDHIAVHVLQLFDPLVVSEDIEIVVAGLPEGVSGEAFGDGEVEGIAMP